MFDGYDGCIIQNDTLRPRRNGSNYDGNLDVGKPVGLSLNRGRLTSRRGQTSQQLTMEALPPHGTLHQQQPPHLPAAGHRLPSQAGVPERVLQPALHSAL